MRNRFVFVLAILFFIMTGVRGEEVTAAGNGPAEDPAGNAGALKEQVQTGGSFSAYSGNASRIVNDLHVPGSLATGPYALDFTRYWNSTHNDMGYPDGEWPLDFGPSGWSHSWHWHADLIMYSEPIGGDPPTEELYHTYIVVTFPDGHMTKYHVTRSNRPHGSPPNQIPADQRLGPPYTPLEINGGWPNSGGMGIRDHLINMAVNGADFWLALADGGAVHFINHSTLGYQAREVFDPHGLKTDLRYNTSGYLYQIEQEGGRSLNLTWGTFDGGDPAITRVETGGIAGPQHVTYQYGRSGYSHALVSVVYADAMALYTYGTCYDDEPEPCGAVPMLKAAYDPHYAGAMTRIRYSYAGDLCQPILIHPEFHPDWVAGQPYRVKMEKSENGAMVSGFALHCNGDARDGEREELNGLGGVRRFYFGTAAHTIEPATWPDTDYYRCMGYQLGKISDFTSLANVPEVPAGQPCPAGVPCHRQNYAGSLPRHIWDGRYIMTGQKGISGDDSGLPYRIDYADNSYSLNDRRPPTSAPVLDPRMHNPYNHLLFNKQDERGNVTTYTRDSRRRVTDISYYDGPAQGNPVAVESFTYNDWNQVETHTLPSGARETYVYDPTTHLLIEESNSIDGPAARKEYTYYGPSNHPQWTDLVEKMTDGRARISGVSFTVKMAYDDGQRVTSVEYPPTGGSAHPIVYYQYDSYGNCTAITDELGHRKDYTYDSYRRCTSLTEQVNGPGAGCNNVTSRRWDWIYDRMVGGTNYPASCHTSKEWRVQIEPAFNEAGERRMTAREHDVNNRITVEQTGWIQPAGPIGPNNLWYQSDAIETHRFTYDENGQKQKYTDPLNRETTYDYDIRNRLWKTNETINTIARTTETLYDTTGNKLHVIFPDTQSQHWENYDPFGQPRRFINENNQPTDLTYQWGPMKKLDTVRTYRHRDDPPAGIGGTETQLTDFDYDGMGRLQWTHFPDTTTELSDYVLGQLSAFKTRRDQTKRLHYDARGRESYHTWDSDAAPGITRVWDDANRLTSIANVFSTVDYGYDDAGQAKWEGSNVAGSPGRTEIRYCHYPSGEAARMTYPNGTVINRFYTARGQLSSVGWGAGSTSYAYLADGKVDYQARENHVTTSYGYDGRGMIGWMKDRYNTEAQAYDLAYRGYHRDERDRIDAWRRGTDNVHNGMEDGRGDRYHYDLEGQLDLASYRAELTQDWVASGAKRSDSFHYDELGNRAGWNYIASKGSMYILRRDNGLNQYKSWETDLPPSNPRHWGSGIFHDDNVDPYPSPPWVYPGNGVVMQDGYVTGSFNALNQPVGIWSFAYQNTANWMFFGYDPLGRCVKRWVGPHVGTPPNLQVPPANTNPATYLYYDGWNLVQEGPSGGTDRIYVHGGRVDEIVASWGGGVWRYHHYDARGHCILLTNTAGTILEQYDYDAFGRPYFYYPNGNGMGTSSVYGNRFLFTGREWIKDLRLYDYRNRMYQPELGRFLQPDPKQFGAGDYNLYRYCHNDPINKSDPDGLDTYQQNREIGGDEIRSNYNIVSHSFTFTTNSDGSIKNTYSWGNDANTRGWNLNQREDIKAAEAAMASGKVNKVGDSKLDSHVDKAFKDFNKKENEHRNLGIARNCKWEATNLLHKAKELQKADEKAKEPARNGPKEIKHDISY